jgi:hypothetical protein
VRKRLATRWIPIAKAAQHRVHPTGGSHRVFEQFAWLEAGSVKVALPPPAHPRVTLTVRAALVGSGGYVGGEGDGQGCPPRRKVVTLAGPPP